jgi:hypothetical protein
MRASIGVGWSSDLPAYRQHGRPFVSPPTSLEGSVIDIRSQNQSIGKEK